MAFCSQSTHRQCLSSRLRSISYSLFPLPQTGIMPSCLWPVNSPRELAWSKARILGRPKNRPMLFLIDLILSTRAFQENSSPITTWSCLVTFGPHYLKSLESSFSKAQLIIAKWIDHAKEQIRQLKLRCNFLYTPLITLDSGPRSCLVSRPSLTILLLLQLEKPQMRGPMASFRTVS